MAMPFERLSEWTEEWNWEELRLNKFNRNGNNEWYTCISYYYIKYPPLLATNRTITDKNNKYVIHQKIKHIYMWKLELLRMWNWKLFVYNALCAVREWYRIQMKKKLNTKYMQKKGWKHFAGLEIICLNATIFEAQHYTFQAWSEFLDASNENDCFECEFLTNDEWEKA